MKKQANHIFNNVEEIEPPKYLRAAILTRISREKAEIIQRKKILFRMGFVFFGALSFLSLIFFGSELRSSEFSSIVSLGFSDIEIIAVHWQSFSLLLLETLPTAVLLALLAPVFSLLVLVRRYAHQAISIKQISI